jgi:hypothetical protein
MSIHGPCRVDYSEDGARKAKRLVQCEPGGRVLIVSPPDPFDTARQLINPPKE